MTSSAMRICSNFFPGQIDLPSIYYKFIEAFLYQTEFLFFLVKWPDLPIFPVLDCPNPSPDPGQGHDYEVNSAGYWVVVESEVD